MTAPSTRRVALINGATDGIGRALVDRFVADGFAVVAFGLDDAFADEVELACDADTVTVVRGDSSDERDVARAVAVAAAQHGRIDVLCNLAAIRLLGDIVDTSTDEWDRTFAVNVRGTYLFCHAVVPIMRERGSGVVLNFGSSSGHGGEGHIAYCASKGAIQALTLSLAMDHVSDGIRANLVIPGSTATAMNRGRDPRLDQAIASRWSVTGAINQPEEIADFVAFLASERASNVSGGVFHVGVVAGEPVRRITI